jgi:D-serine deaminase-like pyridoxal phosphate-dependent protein
MSPYRSPSLTVGQAASDLVLPVMLLKETALTHNIETMAAYCRDMGIELAPHGKTTMSPEIAARQLDHGAWGITVADVRQANVFRESGVRRVLIANEVTNRNSLGWLSEIRLTDPGFHVLCHMDSALGVDLTRGLFHNATPLDVLIEIGFAGGRGGCRDLENAIDVAKRVIATPGLRLAGVSTYEGIVENNDNLVDDLLRRVRELVQSIDLLRGFSDVERIVVSAGGSIYFESVAQRLSSWSESRPVDLVLRSGSYVTHDHGYYDDRSPWGRMHTGPRKLMGAIELWAEVLSIPEIGLAILGFGRRHAPEDHGLPVPIL